MPPLDLTRARLLEFETPDLNTFPCLGLAYRALQAERSLPVVLNAANEVAVSLFLAGRLAFPSIAHIIEETMRSHEPAAVGSIDAIRNVDRMAREHAQVIAQRIQLEV